MVKSLVLCCADDVEIWQGVTRYADVCTLQANKDYPVGWSERQLVSIKATKCVYVYTEDAKINCYYTCLTLVTLDLFHENLNMIVNHDLRPGTTQVGWLMVGPKYLRDVRTLQHKYSLTSFFCVGIILPIILC